MGYANKLKYKKMRKETESKIRIKLIEAIEDVFEDDELISDVDLSWWSDNYASYMAEAALSVLLAQKDECLVREDMLK